MSIRPEIVAARLAQPATCVEPGAMRQIRPCGKPSGMKIVKQVNKKMFAPNPFKSTSLANNAIVVENFNLVYVVLICMSIDSEATISWLAVRMSFACQEANH